jgi:serine/threonine protein kinase
MKTCPTEEQLNDLILGVLPEAIASELTEHLGDCSDCQIAMQNIATGEVRPEVFADSITAAPPRNSAYWDVRQSLSGLHPALINQEALPAASRLRQTVLGDGTDAPQPGSNQLSDDELTFLQPSDDPAFVGHLQDFQVVRVIGRGGMGVVFEAFDPHLHRSVAIKVLGKKFQQDKTAIERFCREGRAAAAISHEHVVPMYQVSRIEEGEIAFLVMQLIDGKTLEDCVKERSPMAADEVARIGMQIAAGLSAAHESGLVHRDIKPGNILIEHATSRVKLTDFGLARITDDVRLTKSGVLLGTVLYMSPEQALGEPVDDRSDLFSLGAVLYEMSTGKSAFDAPTPVGVMKRIMDETPATPQEVNSNIGTPLSELIMQLLSKEPKRRPDSAGQVARALASIVTEHGPISPLQVPVVASSEVRKLSNEHSIVSRASSIAGWIVAGLLLTAIAIFIVADRGDRTDANPVDNVSVTLNSKGRKGEDVTAQFPSVVLGDNPGPVWSIDFSKDGQTIVAGVGDGSVRFWNIQRQEVVRSFNAHAGNVWNVKFHPSLDLFATAGDDSWVKLWDGETLGVKHGWKLDNTVRAIAFAPDGKSLAAADRDGQLHIYDVTTGQEQNMIELDHTTILGIDYSAGGTSIVAAGSDKMVRVFDAETLEERQNFDGHEGPIYSVAFAKNSPLIASVGFKSDTWVWNADTGETVMKLKGFDGDNWGVGFVGESSQHLLTGGQGGTTRLWSLKTGRNIATFKGHTAAVHDFAFDAKRKRIATSSRDGSIRVWDTQAIEKLVD